MTDERIAAILTIACLIFQGGSAAAQGDPSDWPTYNRDGIGSRHNPAEKAIDRTNAGKLVERWRFPAEGSDRQIGVIHATPVVVNGYVYFGTATDPTFYKLKPNGTLQWSYRNPTPTAPPPSGTSEEAKKARFQDSPDAILASALVTENTVYFCDLAGWFYALNRETGKERWRVNTRGGDFPDAHELNSFFGSPILAEEMVIVGGGTLEQVVSAFPGYLGSTGRGYVVAFAAETGEVIWKYDVGPKPEALEPPVTITDSWGTHEFHFGPATSSVWCTPSYDAESGTLYFGTDVNTAPRRPTKDDPRLETRESCAVIALSIDDGAEQWVTQLNPGDVWTNAMRGYDPKDKRYKDQSIGDTPKIYQVEIDGKPQRVVGVGCKNGGFYVLNADSGKILDATPIYTGAPTDPPEPKPDPRMLAFPGLIGGLQTGCATDGKTIFTNGIDALRLGTQETQILGIVPPTGGRVVALSMDLKTERWRHERPKIASIGGPPPIPTWTKVGDPVGSGVCVANGVVYFTAAVSGRLLALDANSGAVLKEIELGPVWSGPSVSRGRVYVGTGNTLFTPMDFESYFPKKYTGVLHSFGLPGEDEVSRLGEGSE